MARTRAVQCLRGRALLACVLALLSLVLHQVAPAAAQERTLKVAFQQINPPLIFADETGKPNGLFVDIFTHIAIQEDWALEWVPCAWPACMDRLQRGNIDILLSVAYSEQRAQRIDFNREVIFTNWGTVIRRSDVDVQSIMDLEGKRIAVAKRSIFTERFSALLKSFRIESAFVERPSYKDAIQAVIDGAAEVGVVNRLVPKDYTQVPGIEKTAIIFNPVELHVATPKGVNANIRNAIDKHIITLKGDPDSAYYAALNKWIFAQEGRPVFPAWVWWALVVGGGLLLISFGFISVLRIKVKSATAALLESRDELELRVEERTQDLRLYETIVSHTSDFMSIVDRDYVFQMVSPAYLRAFNKTSEEIVGHSASNVLGRELFEKFSKSNIDRAFAGENPSYQAWVDFPNIGRRFMDVHYAPVLDADGKVTHVVVVAHDITEIKEAEVHLIQVSKLASLGEMATGAAHEINQPLNIIRMSADTVTEMLEGGEPPSLDQLKTKLERISSQTERAADIIDRMRIFGRKSEGHTTKVSPKKAVLGAVSFLREQLRLDGIELELDLPDTCRSVMGDPIQLEQVILNLLTNAHDAIMDKAETATESEGSDHITVRIEDDPETDAIRLVVEDTGDGIPENVLSQIFNPFFTTKEIGKGTGVGLSITYGIITEMGGTVVAENVDGGARFTVTLPAVNDEPDRA